MFVLNCSFCNINFIIINFCVLSIGNKKTAFWDTYSSFANTFGGTILLSVDESRETKKLIPDYLPGRSEQGGADPSVPITDKSLPVFHRKPV